ncbi:MAG: hypothetical protein QM770_10015 [Tepidisphaeraceae bacterium]
MYDFDRKQFIKNISAVGLLGLVLALGCESAPSNDPNYYPPPDSNNGPDYGRPGYDRPDYDRPNYDDRPYDGMPWRADLVARNNDKVRWRAVDEGSVFISDDTDRTLLTWFKVHRDDTVEIIPKDDEIKLNGRDVYPKDLHRNNRHAIFFLRERDYVQPGGWQGGSDGGWDHRRPDNDRPDYGRPGNDRPNNDRPNRPGNNRPDDTNDRLPSELRGFSSMVHGRDNVVYQTGARGRMVVFDRTDNRVVHRVDVGRGDRLIVASSRGYIRLEADKARSGNTKYRLDTNHDYVIYFRPTE